MDKAGKKDETDRKDKKKKSRWKCITELGEEGELLDILFDSCFVI